MKLSSRPLNLEVGGKYIVILNKEDADFLGLHALDRVCLSCKGKEITAIVDITKRFTMKGEIVTSDDVTNFFNLKGGEHIDVTKSREPESITYIKQKISGCRLDYDKIKKIVKDVVDRKLSDIELTAFVTSLYTRGIAIDEATAFTKAMVETGKKFKLNKNIICDKHSIGGIPGDKTSLILVPIVAAAGLTIPKTSSRAITSPAGTADRMEVLAPVSLTLDEIEEIVKKINACLVWGGALDISPADDEFIKIEYPLGIDPMLLPSIMSKKKAIGAKYVVVDIPTGREAKITTVQKARELAEDFLELGKRLGMIISCGVTFGEQPLGYCIGPALEAREALLTLQGKGPRDLIEKSTMLADMLFNEVGVKDHGAALEILRSGKAEKKMREIIEAQGGDSEIKPENISVGDKVFKVKSDAEGKVLWIKNSAIVLIAREAGAPKDKGSGIHLNVKMGDAVKKGSVLFSIHSNNYIRLSDAIKLAEELKPIVVGKKFEEKMLLERIFTEIPTRKIFMLER
ncbi:AMP phosphorylase [Candidatus Micrarchaeota archaeon RBG_16_36_9]|nr:MAG: AMP phosphorylase [Candidatus Micrarchaeota archaeon RBG_16_36_9]